MENDTFLELKGITKAFPGVLALDKVSFSAKRGEVHALCGENGAGKSTLIKVLTGVYPGDGGKIGLDGQTIVPTSPRNAETKGISTVYQEVNLIPHLTVAENICLGREDRLAGVIRWRRVWKRAAAAIKRLDLKFDINLDAQLSDCSIAIQQMVAIARALDIDAKLLILDEPTSSLDDAEAEELFRIMRTLREQGMGIVFVTHFLDQVYRVSDHITVLRNGELVGEFTAVELPRLELVSKMVGKNVEEVKKLEKRVTFTSVSGRKTVVSARRLGRKGAINPIDFTLNEGEVVGLAGLLGSGRSETANLLFGVDPADSGELEIDGRRIRPDSPARAMRYGFGMLTEDRKFSGIVPNLSVRENIILAMQAKLGPWRKIPSRRANEIADQFIKALDIKTPSREQQIKNLSGGNQQKVIIARWLAVHPRLLILDEPTRGIDVGAKAEIEGLIQKLREEGMSLLLISSELEEVVRNSSRVIVLRDRTKITELSGDNLTERSILEVIASQAKDDATKETLKCE
ncbi:MAG: sugar ABC transporter ATP-binding protein [Planctomycetota bacterium]|jgi:simple sugar transport system ATP-binding protein|nr:sugar ABC transporter ATP-binding protein [Planctomycetota bacterium]